MNLRFALTILLVVFTFSNAEAGFSFSFLKKPFKRGPNAKADDPEERAYATMLADSKSISADAKSALDANKINQQQYDAVIESLKFGEEHYKPYYKYNQEFHKMKPGSLSDPAVAKEWETKLNSFCQRQHKSAIQFMDSVNNKKLVIQGESAKLIRRVENLLEFSIRANGTSDFFCHTDSHLRDDRYVEMLRSQATSGSGKGADR